MFEGSHRLRSIRRHFEDTGIHPRTQAHWTPTTTTTVGWMWIRDRRRCWPALMASMSSTFHVVHGHLVVARQRFLLGQPPRQDVNEPRWQDDVDQQILVDRVAIATDAALQLKHRGKKRIAGCFLLDALAKAHLSRVAVLWQITDEIDDELQLRRVGRLGDLWVHVHRNDRRFLHQLVLVLLELRLHSDRR